jgi:hypothetical protein
VQEFGAGCRWEGLQSLAQCVLHLVEGHGRLDRRLVGKRMSARSGYARPTPQSGALSQ